jgi:DnaJ-class molecular chaperone
MNASDPAKFMAELGFTPLCQPSIADLKKRWKELCLKHHPDKGGSREDFERVTHAYKMLTDPSYRHAVELDEIKRSMSNKKGDLNIRIVTAVSFEDAFFGRRLALSYSLQEFDEDFKLVPIALEKILEVRTIEVQLWPGRIQNTEFIVKGRGHKRKEEYGDALVLVHILQSEKYQVKEDDVYSKESVPLDIMLKGGKLEFPTMWGIKTGYIKPGSQPGDKVKIRHAGVNQGGHHYVELQPIFPTKEDLKNDSWKVLDIGWKEAEEEQDKEAADFENIFFQGGGQKFKIDIGSINSTFFTGTGTTGGY